MHYNFNHMCDNEDRQNLENVDGLLRKESYNRQSGYMMVENSQVIWWA